MTAKSPAARLTALFAAVVTSLVLFEAVVSLADAGPALAATQYAQSASVEPSPAATMQR